MCRVATVGELGLFVGDVPSQIVTPTSVSELSNQLKTGFEAILIGLQSAKLGREILNPKNDERVEREDQVIYLAESPIEPEPRS